MQITWGTRRSRYSLKVGELDVVISLLLIPSLPWQGVPSMQWIERLQKHFYGHLGTWGRHLLHRGVFA